MKIKSKKVNKYFAKYSRDFFKLNNEKNINENLNNINIAIRNNSFYLNEIKVDEDIRSVEITKNVSKIASYKKVREFLVEQQRLIAKSNSCILDGRDIGSVVFPNADYKFFMTATPETRARRYGRGSSHCNRES